MKNSIRYDIRCAKKLINSGESIKDKFFNESSSVYRFSNEKIMEYEEYLKNRKRIFSITASGDQILNSILFGSEKIDSIDISRFPKYYFELKKAAIQSLSRKEYLHFFIPEEYIHIDDKERLDMYSGFNCNMSKNDKFFWDKIFKKYSLEALFSLSSLFKGGNYYDYNSLCIKNPYLQEDNYEILKQRISNVDINHYVGNIYEEVAKFQDSYDLVYLSNIIDYAKLLKYKQLVESFNLSFDGIVLSYTFDNKLFFGDDYEIKNTNHHSQSIMIYKRGPKV